MITINQALYIRFHPLNLIHAFVTCDDDSAYTEDLLQQELPFHGYI
jgi:hypothetical protein